MQRTAGVALLCAAALVCVSCGYALAGRGNALPEKIRIIGVPDFTNRSTVANVDRVLADAVRREFINKGKYEVRPESGGVDGLLTVTIISALPRPKTFDTDNRPSSYVIEVIANVEFKDLTDPAEGGKVLWANPSFRMTDDYETAGTSGVLDQTALNSASDQALERLGQKFAKDVVTSIFEAF